MFSTKVAYADFDSFLTNVNSTIVNPLIDFLFALALLYFLWGTVEFLMNQENEDKKTSGKSHMFWGIIGIFVMMAVWGLLSLIVNTLGIDGDIDPEQGSVTLPDYDPPFP